MALALAVTAAAPLALVVLVVQNWVDIPYMDDWALADTISRHHEGTLCFKYLAAQHNESRTLFPRLIVVGLSLVSRWDVRWQMCLSLLFAAFTYGGLWLLVRRSMVERSLQRHVIFLLMSLLVFSPVQWANWLWGIQIVAFIPPLLLTIGLLVNTSPHALWVKSILTSILAFVATYSFANGMILWLLIAPPAFLPLLKPRAARDTRALAALGWYTVAAVASIGFYFYDYHTPAGKPPLSHVLNDPSAAAAYYLSWMGNPLIPRGSALSSAMRQVVGGLLLAIWLTGVGVAVRRSRCAEAVAPRSRAYPWIMLGLYSILSGMVATVGRSGFGLEQATESRYTTFALPLVVAAVGLGAELFGWCRREFQRTRGACATTGYGMIVLLLALHGQAVTASLPFMRDMSSHLRRVKTALLLHRIAPDDAILRTIHPIPSELMSDFARLKRHGQLNYDAMELPAFREGCSRAGQPDQANGWLDAWARRGDKVAFGGWVRLGDRGIPGTNVILTWAGSDSIPHPLALALPGVPRPDVVELLPDGRFARCGFAGTGSLRDVPPGRVSLDAWTVDTDDWSIHHLANARPFLTRPGRPL